VDPGSQEAAAPIQPENSPECARSAATFRHAKPKTKTIAIESQGRCTNEDRTDKADKATEMSETNGTPRTMTEQRIEDSAIGISILEKGETAWNLQSVQICAPGHSERTSTTALENRGSVRTAFSVL
jgi:hypothetical protein